MADDDLLGTLQAPPPAITQMPPMGQLGAVLSGLGAGMRGQPNPVLGQIQQQQESQFQQQVQLMGLKFRIQQERQKKLTLNLQMNKEMLDAAKDPTLRQTLAGQRAEFFKQGGLEVPTGMVQDWAARTYTPEQEKQFVLAFLDQEKNPNVLTDVMERFHLPPDRARYYQSLSQHEPYLKASNLPTRNAMRSELATAQKLHSDAWLATNPGFKDTGNLHGVAGYAQEYVRTRYGKSLYDLTADNPQDAVTLDLAQTYARAKAQFSWERDQKFKSKTIEERLLDVLKEKTALGPKPMSIRDQIAATQAIEAASTTVPELQTMRVAARSLQKDGYMPADASITSVKWAELMRWWNLSGDPRVTAINQLSSPVFIGQIDRVLNKEKGTRAMTMFLQQIEITKKLPTLQSYESLLDLYHYLLARAAAREVHRLERMKGKIPDEVIMGAQEDFLKIFPKGVPKDPTGLKLP